MRCTEDLNPFVKYGEQPGAVLGAETMPADSVPESLGARRFANESYIAVDGVGGGERLAMTAADAMEMLGATARATESSEVGARATGAVSEPEA